MNAIGLVKEGNRDEAKEILEEAKQMAGHLSLRINRARAYAAIAEASAQIEEAARVLHFTKRGLFYAECRHGGRWKLDTSFQSFRRAVSSIRGVCPDSTR